MIGDMQITEVMRPSCINLNLQGTTKDEIIREMSEMLYQEKILTSKEAFIRDVYERESEGPTGVGDGIAIPHGKSDAVIVTSVAVGRAVNEIEWESLDEQPVRVFVMFAVNSADKSELVGLLAQVAVALCDEEVVERLFLTDSVPEVIELLGKRREDMV